MPSISCMPGDETFAVFVDERQQIGLLLVGYIPRPFSHIEDRVKVIQISHVEACDWLFREQTHIGSDDCYPSAGLAPEPFNRCQGVRSRIMVVSGRGVPLLRIGDGEKLFHSGPRIVWWTNGRSFLNS